MRKIACITFIVAFVISAVCSAQETHATPTEEPVTKITSPDDLKKISSEITDLIAPFTIEDIRNGFKNEPSLSGDPSGVVVKKGSGVQDSRMMMKPRPTGGRVSVEVELIDGNIKNVQFKLLPDRAGFQALWNAQPVVVLSKRVASDASDGIGFEEVEIRRGDKTTRYELLRNEQQK